MSRKSRDIRPEKKLRPKREEKKSEAKPAATEKKPVLSSQRQKKGIIPGTKTTYAVVNARARKKRNRRIREEVRRSGVPFETIRLREEAERFGIAVK